VCTLGQVLRLSIACLYGVVGGGWALSVPLVQKGNSYHFILVLMSSSEKFPCPRCAAGRSNALLRSVYRDKAGEVLATMLIEK